MAEHGALNNFHRLTGIFVEEAGAGEAVVRLDASEHVQNASGVIHGGAIFSVADASIATALRSLHEPGTSVATIEMKINYLAPAYGELRAHGTIVHAGGRIAHGESSVRDADGKLVARALATFAVIRRP